MSDPVKPALPISDKTRIAEITAAVMVAVGKFVFMDWLNWWLPFVLTVIICWTAYVIYQSKKKPGILQRQYLRQSLLQQDAAVLPVEAATAPTCTVR
jgi:hypothetical protein